MPHGDALEGKRRGERGIIKQHIAAQLREEARVRDPNGPPDIILMREADAMELAARADLTPDGPLVMGAGGEAIPTPDGPADRVWGLALTLEDGNQVNRDASRTRMDLANAAGVLSLAVDAAQTIQAENSLEKALAHQMAAAHALSMKLMQKATDGVDGYRMDSSHVQRLVNSAARLMSSFQQGLQTIQRVRTGGKQEVRVVHVHQQVQVNGGQVAVAGSVGADSSLTPGEGGCSDGGTTSGK